MNPIIRSRNVEPFSIRIEYNPRVARMPLYVDIVPNRRVQHRSDIFERIAAALVSSALQTIHRYKPNLSDSLVLRSMGVLQMNNVNANMNLRTMNRRISYGEIDGQFLLDMFDTATNEGSNPDLEFNDVSWRLVFGHEYSRGAGGPISDVRGMFKGAPSFPGIGCLSIALAIGYARHERKHQYIKKNLVKKGFLATCEAVQRVVGYDPDGMNFTHEINSFVKVYKTFRVAVISATPHLIPRVFRGDEWEFNEDSSKERTILIHNRNNHYYVVSAPGSMFSKAWDFCRKCTGFKNASCTRNCQCGDFQRPVKKYPIAKCEKCGKSFQGKKTDHMCGFMKCKFGCALKLKFDSEGKIPPTHRCPIYEKPKKFMKMFAGTENPDYDEWYRNKYSDEDGNPLENVRGDDEPSLFAFDYETVPVPIPGKTTRKHVFESGRVVGDGGEFVTIDTPKTRHTVCFVAVENVFTGEKFTFTDGEEFARFVISAKSYFFAHNSARYDTRLLFPDAIRVLNDPKNINATVKGGSSFMRLSLEKSVVMDSLNHLSGSLASLAKAFKCNLMKGYFPYLLEDLTHVGDIPPKEMFGLEFSHKDDAALADFESWHSAWHEKNGPVWNAKNELKKYCVNDVSILAYIMRSYHEGITKSLKRYPHVTVSPWFFATNAGYIHKVLIRNSLETSGIEEMTIDERLEYLKNEWVTLTPEEYYFSKCALRGGLTDVFRYHYKGPIAYKDIQSAYPAVQLDRDLLYPVGAPVVEVHDEDYYPCNLHYTDPKSICRCSIFNRRVHGKKGMIVKEVLVEDLHGYIADFFGMIMVDMTPNPKLLHPVINIFDETRNKCVSTNERMFKQVVTSEQLKLAIEMGTVVTKIYRADRYKAGRSKFCDGILGDLYVEKLRNSNTPPAEDVEEMTRVFRDKYGIDIGDTSEWKLNPILRQAAKVPITAAWGKHCESPDHTRTNVWDLSTEEGMDSYGAMVASDSIIKGLVHLEDGKFFVAEEERRTTVKPDLHKGYIPIGVFITAYNRMKLWRELNKLGDRAIYCDTDSIVYAIGDIEKDYQIQEGKCLGDWETEDIQAKNGGLVEFCAIAPKSYFVKTANGKIVLKLKGAQLKLAQDELMTPDIMKTMLFEGSEAILPQMTFTHELGGGGTISTVEFLKRIKFQRNDVKGEYDPSTYRKYPFGYTGIRE
jgi:hypothetical protein